MIRFMAVNNIEKFNDQLIGNIEEVLKENGYKVETAQDDEKYWSVSINANMKYTYYIYMEFETFEKYEQLGVCIQAKEQNDEYDEVLEKIKVLIKKCILNNWNGSSVIWIADQQSTYLANLLYKSINITENHLRMLINLIMNAHFGVKWWDDIVPPQLKEKYTMRRGHYKRTAPSFNDVSDYLISIDVDDLIKLMTLEIKEVPENIFDELKPVIMSGNLNKLIAQLQKKMIVKSKLWDEVYSRYFSNEFLTLWNEFYKDRNHIAHNKLIDKAAYTNILSVVKKVEEMLIHAEEAFDKDVISDERKERIKIFMQQQEEEYRAAEEEWIEDEAGVEVKNIDSIYEEFNEPVTMFVDDVVDDLLYRDEISIERNDFVNDGVIDLVCAESDVHDCKLIIRATSEYNDEAGAESSVKIQLIVNDEIIDKGMFTYINGAASFDEEQGCYMPETENEFYKVHIDELKETIRTTIENKMPDLEVKLEKIIEDKSKEIEEYTPVYHIDCPSCWGEDSISCDNDFYPIGRCYRCGEEFNIAKCEVCGKYFIDDDETGKCEQCSIQNQEDGEI